MCKRHLNPGGVIAQWVPLYESDTDTVKSEIATFFEVFPDGIVWSNDTAIGEGYDVVLFGQNGPTTIDVEAHATAPGPSGLRAREAIAARGGL